MESRVSACGDPVDGTRRVLGAVPPPSIDLSAPPGFTWAFADPLHPICVPVAYWLLYANTPGHGMPVSAMDQEDEPAVAAEPDVSGCHDKSAGGRPTSAGADTLACSCADTYGSRMSVN
jgi:hypothetical protein